MKPLIFSLLLLGLCGMAVSAQELDTLQLKADSLRNDSIRVAEAALKAREDSIRRVNQALADSIQRQAERLQLQADSIKQANQIYVDSLKANEYPVILKDTLLYIYSGIGNLNIQERAQKIEKRLQDLVNRLDFNADSLLSRQDEGYWNILHKDEIILTVTQEDSVGRGLSREIMAQNYLNILRKNLLKQREYKSLLQRLQEIGLTLIALLIIYILYRLTNRVYRYLLKLVVAKKDIWFKGFVYNKYEVLTPERQLNGVTLILKGLRLLSHLLMLYLTLPIIFSIFPATRGFATTLLGYVLNPLRNIVANFLAYIPNLFAIVVIYLCTRYMIRFMKFISHEIQEGKLVLQGFYADWAQPTYNIIRVLTYAFMFVLVFPYLPYSDNQIFQGVTVFVGVLFSLGSSSAISNMVAGIVITYMRPFKLGDRVKIGDLVGDVAEKNLLVTRIKTVKNEEITIPNSSILNGHTINYTSSSQLILYSTVTIGYDVPWKQVHQLLIRAAQLTEGVLKEPAPFVLQTSLDDFYVSYEINAYSNYAKSIAETYSELHQHIQDQFNEAGVEILSPHYRAARDGSQVTIPSQYLPDDYEAPPFKFKIDKGEGK